MKNPNENKQLVRGLPGIGFKLTDDGKFDIESKRLSNIADPIAPKDAVNVNFLKAYSQNKQKEWNDLRDLKISNYFQKLYKKVKTQEISQEQLADNFDNNVEDSNHITVQNL